MSNGDFKDPHKEVNELSKITYSFYPEGEDAAFYLEFIEYSDKKRFKLMQRHREDWAVGVFNPKGELHGWNLASGDVAPPNVISLYTEKFLKCMVNAMNFKHETFVRYKDNGQ